MEDKKPLYEQDYRIFKVPTIHTYFTSRHYSIFRIGKKYKTIGDIGTFKKHMEREMEVPNADFGKKNYILIGDSNIKENAEKILNTVKVRKNAVVGRELLLTASPGFFQEIDQDQFDKWVQLNIEFLQDNFNNVVYAVLHLDEVAAPHIHVYLIPLNDKGNLSNSYYFNGRVKMREWQTKYYEKMNNTFSQLQRGTERSKANHEDIQKFYTLISKDLNEQDLEQIKAKAKYAELLEIKIKSTEKTLEAYKKQNERLKEDNKRISVELSNLQSKVSLWEKVSNYIALVYKVPQKRFNEMVDYIRGEKIRG